MNKIENNVINSGTLSKREKEYWYEKLDGIHSLSKFKGCFENERAISKEKLLKHYSIQADIAEKIGKIGNNSNYMIYTFLLAGFKVVLHKHNLAEQNLVVGMPIFKIRGKNSEQSKNILLINSNVNATMSFRQLLTSLKDTISQADKHRNLPYSNILKKLKIGEDTTDRINLVVSLENIHGEVEKCDTDILFKFSIKENLLYLDVEYKEMFDESDINRIVQQLIRVYREVIKNIDKKILEIELLDAFEKEQIVKDFNNTKTYHPKDKTIHSIFEEQVDKTPKKTAIVCGQERLTYEELNTKANQLAQKIKEQGIKSEDVIGIVAERSTEMVLAMLAVLKNGCAYLPIDPRQPVERKQFLIHDSQINLLLVYGKDNKVSGFEGTIFDLTEKDLYIGNKDNPVSDCSRDNLAYIMYTSGSTGQPKGVMIEHRCVIRLVINPNFIQFEPSDCILQTGAVAFDASTFEIWGALLNGLKLYLATDDVVMQSEKLAQTIEKQGVTILWLTSSLFNQLSWEYPTMFKNLRYLLVGGEALSLLHIERVRKSCPKLQLINGYGPTENTTFSLCHIIDKTYETSIPIGKPINNTVAYIVGEGNQLQPIGAAGEILVGGAGVARGYVNNQEMTVEKFIDDPFITGKQVYRTGDLGRWLPDGTIEYLGRIDNQVKIRGFRIEPEEIETVLLTHEKIREAVVFVKIDQKGNRYLCASLVLTGKLRALEIREYLLAHIPEYMVPTEYREITEIPLTLNGKVDIRTLAEAGEMMHSDVLYEAPTNEKEELLVKIWQEVLGVEQVGIRDNFFELGGDSIKAIQVAARLNNVGLRLEIRNLLLNPTIISVRTFIEEVVNESQEPVTGEVGLTPIQNWFFEEDLANPNHFNQAFMLHSEQGFDEKIVIEVFKEIVKHHDALRMVYSQKENQIIQHNNGIEGKLYDFEAYQLTGKDYQDEIERIANILQTSMDLEKGPLVKVALFHTVKGDELLIVIHHLVVDVVSWRIIFEDFMEGYNQCLRNEKISLPKKTSSFKAWSEGLIGYAQGKELQKEYPYWCKIAEKQEKLKVEGSITSRKRKNLKKLMIRFSQIETEKLLKKSGQAFNTEINDLLLTALGLSINTWQDLNSIVINLEGHGREEIINELDVTRTVGWFTSVFPILLTVRKEETLSEAIKRVKEELRQVPNKGVGYQILRYLDSEEKRAALYVKPDITFNYLGQLDIEGEMEFSNISAGNDVGKENEIDSIISINAIVSEGELIIQFIYNKQEFKKKTIEEFSETYKKELLKIIEHCTNNTVTERTISDFSDNDLDLQDLEEIWNQMN
ncbi:amino acid adenylation domain-containing protein [Enterococcus larvae]|uniref:amino acid adenylation domain-containing protein n=1 Tax=Enterococcus larvae TaxID=2794352 RepID=UPI003F3CE93C